MNQLQDEPIDYNMLTESIRNNQAGAVVLFLGTVRELTEGRKTIALDYEAHSSLALKELERIEAEARERWPMIISYGCIHRLGHLELGEISVAIAISTPHRVVAFEACQYVMERIKQTVPIWKKENWADGGTEWVHPG